MEDRDLTVPGARDVREVLKTDPIYKFAAAFLRSPWGLGVVLAIIIIVMIILGPATESRFIYTDF